MNAPNKIYTDNRGVYASLPIFSQIDANVEYIRKDALLEWLKERRAEHSFEVRKAYQRTIEKIESL